MWLGAVPAAILQSGVHRGVDIRHWIRASHYFCLPHVQGHLWKPDRFDFYLLLIINDEPPIILAH